ncbi:MAG TPA: hypothetical protein VEB86_17550 [Chryseosolibacter sp.]|nr:hypothetical protein [Chryseosolibacter sp.]
MIALKTDNQTCNLLILIEIMPGAAHRKLSILLSVRLAHSLTAITVISQKPAVIKWIPAVIKTAKFWQPTRIVLPVVQQTGNETI